MRSVSTYRILIYCLLTFLFTQRSEAQFIKVSDTSFAKFLCAQYPFVMDTHCVYLDTTKAQTTIFNGVFDCHNQKIHKFNEIVYFFDSDTILASQNFIDSIPELNYENFGTVDYLDLSYNNFESFPRIGPSTLIKTLLLNNNKLNSYPLIQVKHSLTNFSISQNELTSIPDFLDYTVLISADLSMNRLTFEDLLPIVSRSDFSTVFTCFPQKEIVTQQYVKLNEGDNFIFDLGVDNSISTNSYAWYHNDILIATTSVNKLEIPGIQKSDEGYYQVIVTNSNPLMNGAELRSTKLFLSVCNIKAMNLNPSIEQNCNVSDIRLDTTSLSGGVKPYKLFLSDNFGLILYQGNQNLFSSMGPGSYNLIIEDQQGCMLTLNDWLLLESKTSCDPVITPNNDGVQDEFYMSEKGIAAIHNINGKLIKKVSIPGKWDAKDESGALVAPGVYYIKLNDLSILNITVIY